MKATAIVVAFLSVAGIGTACAGPQFTADAIETEPGHDMRYVRMFVGDRASRLEFQVAGQPVVEIVRAAEGKVLTLFPLSRTYTEGQASPGASFAELRADAPCQPSPGTGCKMEADRGAAGEADGSKLERWVISRTGDPAEVRVWWDPQRKMAVRQEFPDGRVMQATMRGTTPFEGRTVENWEILYLSPGGMYRRGISIYAPDLGFSVAEQQPGGVARELRNIQPGAPDPKLFEVPEGYQNVALAEPPEGISGGAPVRPEFGAPPAPQPASPATTQPHGMGNQGAMAPMQMPQMAMPMQQGQPAQYTTPFGSLPRQGQQMQAPAATMMPQAPQGAAQIAPQPVAPQFPIPAAQMPQGQPTMPPAYPSSAYGTPWAPQIEAAKPGGITNQAGNAVPFNAAPGFAPYPGAPANTPAPLKPYAWQLGQAPQFQRPENQAPATGFGRNP